MSQDAPKAPASGPAFPGAPEEEPLKSGLPDWRAGDLQDTRGQDTTVAEWCPSSEELEQKTSPGTLDKGEADHTTKAPAKEASKESSNMASPKEDGISKAQTMEAEFPGTRDTEAPETEESRDGSETRTQEGSKKEAPQQTGATPGDSSTQPTSGPQCPALIPVARIGQESQGPSEATSSLQPKKVEDGTDKEERGKAGSPAQGTPPPPEPECNNSKKRSDQGQEKDTGDQSREVSGKQMLPQKGSTSTEQKTSGPLTSGLDEAGNTVGRETPTRTEVDPPATPGLTEEDPFAAQPGTEGERMAEFYQVIDDTPPPSAPFPHRFVRLRTGDVNQTFNIHTEDILGGGRFGDVHKCTEKSTGLQLVAKVMKIQDSKEKEMALNEVDVMNQLNHLNLIQMFDALETPSAIYLFLEYVEGGELFERIIDENYQLTEMDAMVFVRQICEGIYYMHQMYVLHLDLKPENIVCVSQTGHMVKIIDFGLARRYKPREKLRVSFGTPEFLAPEVVNFDFVSFPTDMWSLGVITYMMLSGLSPFLGDNDTETMNNVLSSEVDFNEEPFENVSDEAKDFICNLLIREKGGRLSASQCLRHPWLNDLAEKAKRCNRLLKSQIELRKYMMRRRWKKNFFAVTAANRFKKISSSTSLATLEM